MAVLIIAIVMLAIMIVLDLIGALLDDDMMLYCIINILVKAFAVVAISLQI